MKAISAFIDESGDPRFNDGASTHIYYACVLVEKDYEEELINKLHAIKKSLNLSEIKSSAIQTENRRISILQSLEGLEFKFLSLSIDKELVWGEWRKYPRVFYKYTQKILHKKLHSLYDDLNLTLDKFGSPKYQESFKQYLETEFQLELFDNSLQIGSAKENEIIQLADFFAGTKRKLDLNEFEKYDTIKELLTKFHLFNFSWPTDFRSILIEEITDEQNKLIAENSIAAAERYIAANQYKASEQAKVLTLEYLLFCVRYYNPDEYTYTIEIINWLKERGLTYSEEEFRSQIIGQLRERNVIIIGSNRGLKIPVSMRELNDYLSLTTSKYLTIIRRTKITIDTIKASSLGKIDILKNDSFKLHKDIFDLLDQAKIL
jgi:Protein of unknown function (DUF3800)